MDKAIPEVPDPNARTSGFVKSADRVMLVLEHLAKAESRQSLSALHRELGIPKSSLHGVLRTLSDRAWVETDESGTLFGVGVRALLVGTSYIDSDYVVAGSRQVMDKLAHESGETVHLGRLDQTEIVYLATRRSTHYLRTYERVGRRLPAHATALGKAILAHYSPGEVRQLLDQHLVSVTENTLVDIEELLADLQATRERGYALDNEENTVGVACFAVSLPPPPRVRVQDAISLSVPVARLQQGDRRMELIDLLLSLTGAMPPGPTASPDTNVGGPNPSQ